MKVLANSRGIALVITLLAVTFLVAVTVQLTSSVNLQMQTAGNERQMVRLEQMLASGLNLVQASLAADQKKNKYDSFFDDWNRVGSQGDAQELFGIGSLSITITDLAGRLQVNSLVMSEEQRRRWEQERRQRKKPGKSKNPENRSREVWQRFLTSGLFAVEDEEQAGALLDALIDWLDRDNQERDRGAENSYYAGLTPPYACRNGPMRYVEELLLVKGFSRAVVYGDDDHEGIISYITVAGDDGRVNINTAPMPVLKALNSELTEEHIGELLAFREKKENKDVLADDKWYRGVKGFPGDITLDPELITIRSGFFRVACTASVNNLVLHGHGVLQRQSKEGQTLLYWKVD